MIITGGDISAASREYQAGERDAAAEFKNGFSGNRELAHLFCQRQPRGPHHAKQRPRRRRHAGAFGRTVGSGKLLTVEQRADAEVAAADVVIHCLDFVTRHRALSVKSRLPGLAAGTAAPGRVDSVYAQKPNVAGGVAAGPEALH